MFVVAYLALWLGVLAARFIPGTWWRYVIAVCAVVALACGGSVAADTILSADAGAGVVVADDVIVRKGNGEGFEPQFEEPLYQGVEFELVGQRPGWWHIRLRDGNSGWIGSDRGALVFQPG